MALTLFFLQTSLTTDPQLKLATLVPPSATKNSKNNLILLIYGSYNINSSIKLT